MSTPAELTTPAFSAADPPGRPAARPVRARPAAVLTIIAAGAVAVIGLWWQGTPAIHGWGDWLTNAGRRARLWFLTGRRADLGGDPLTPAVLTASVPGLTRHDVYLCGPDEMTAALARSLRAAGVPRRQIHHESFTF